MHREFFKFIVVVGLVILGMVVAKASYGQCWGCVVSAPFVVGPPVIIMQPAPVYVMPAPVIVQPAPVIIEQPAPVIVQQAPVPQPIAPPVIVETPRGRQCWKQYAGSDNWGQPMYIQACN